MIASFITNVTLYMYEGSGQSATATIYAYQYTGSTWTETNATCSNISWNGVTSPYTRESADDTFVVKSIGYNPTFEEEAYYSKGTIELRVWEQDLPE